jgi:general secretion pathway protein G
MWFLILLAIIFYFGYYQISCGPWDGTSVSASAQIHVLFTALDSYRLDVGTYPTSEQGLQALRLKPEGAAGWDGPYLQKDVPNDPWNNPYVYKFPSKNPGQPEIISYGADGKPGGTGENADIYNE